MLPLLVLQKQDSPHDIGKETPSLAPKACACMKNSALVWPHSPWGRWSIIHPVHRMPCRVGTSRGKAKALIRSGIIAPFLTKPEQ